MPDQPISRAEFAKQIKAKHPVYATVPDDQLVDRMLEKYPVYRERVTPAGATAPPASAPAERRMATPNEIAEMEMGAQAGVVDFGAGFLKRGLQTVRDLGARAREQHQASGGAEYSPDLFANADTTRTTPMEKTGAAVEQVAEWLPVAAGGRALLKAGVKAIPTRAKAGEKFQQVMGKVGQQPVDMARPGDAALRIAEMAERGGSMPKVVRDLLKRATDPNKADITYREARDFYSNISRLSADEYQRLTPAIKMEVGKLRVALDRALAQTAAKGGQEEAYRAAMKEYKVASRMREFAEKAAKWTAGAVGVGAAYKAGEALLGK